MPRSILIAPQIADGARKSDGIEATGGLGSIYRELTCVVAASSLVLGCSGQSDDSTVPEGDIRAMTMRRVVSARTPTVLALVVDDIADDGATALRNGLADAAWLQDQPVAPSADFCPSSIGDPMHLNPIDLRTVVVHPSAPADQRLVTPNEAPALSRTGEINDANAYAAWKSAIQSAIKQTPTSAQGYALIDAVSDTRLLLTGARAPRSTQEQLQLVSLGLSADTPADQRASALFVNTATAHDDASPLDASADGDSSAWINNDVSASTFVTFNIYADDVTGTQGIAAAQFFDTTGPYPRLATWLAPAHDAGGLPGMLDDLSYVFKYRMWDDLKPLCMTAEPRKLDDGSAACRILLTTPTDSPCSAAQGLFDPLIDGTNRAPQTTTISGAVYRLCEIRQFDGDDLKACLGDTTLPAPGPGWCLPDAPAHCNDLCPDTEPFRQHFRFVGGVDTPVSGGAIESTCEI